MQKRKIVKKNKSKHRKRAGASEGTAIETFREECHAERERADPKYPVTIYFFNRPLLYKAFKNIAEEKGIELRKLILSFASLGLKAYLKHTGRAFKDD